MSRYAWDMEVFQNYLLVCFGNEDGFSYFEYLNEEKSDTQELENFLSQAQILVGYNSRNYDNAMLCEFLKTKSASKTREKSDKLINSEEKRRNPFSKPLSVLIPSVFSGVDIDVMTLLNIHTSLKVCECALRLPSIAECPIPFDSKITPDTASQILQYCFHDVQAVWEMTKKKDFSDALRVRETITSEFGLEVDILSYSEPTIVSSVLPVLGKKHGKVEQKKSYGIETFEGDCFGSELIDNKISFENRELVSLLETSREHKYISQGEIEKKTQKISVFGSSFSFACGGLHSENSFSRWEANQEFTILDFDVASYYPALILKYEVAPSNWTDSFLAVYREIMDSRIRAKKEKNKAKANAYKLILNSTFGKLKSEHSVIHNKPGQLRVTLNGQFWILKLLDMIFAQLPACQVIQANTDGITLFCKRTECDFVRAVCSVWENQTGFALEEKEYQKIVMQNVNNYIAIDAKGEVKTKGLYCPHFGYKPGIKIAQICKTAILERDLNQTKISDTIYQCRNEYDFLVYGKRAKLWFNGTLLQGKVYRGYYSKNGGLLEAETKVSKTTVEHGFKLTENIREFDFHDINYDRYIIEAEKYSEKEETNESFCF